MAPTHYTLGEPNRDDWPTTLAAFRDLFADRIVSRPADAAPGRNFITDEVLGFVRTSSGTAEVSTGHGIPERGQYLGARIFGVTFGPNRFGPDPRSKCCHSWNEVAELVRDPWQFPNAATREVVLTLDNDRDTFEAVRGLAEPMDLRSAWVGLGNEAPNDVSWWWIAGYRDARGANEEGANR